MESGIHGCGIRNPQTWNPESTAWNPESKTLLDYLTWGEKLLNENRAWLYSVQQVAASVAFSVERLQRDQSFSSLVSHGFLETQFGWSFDNTNQLINLDETFPCLFDVRSKVHKNRDTRDKALVEIATQLGTTSE